MLELVDKKEISIEVLVEKMCHAPARIFNINKRGYIEKGFHADFVLLNPKNPHTVTTGDIISKCGWSPFEGMAFSSSIINTMVNGTLVVENGILTGNRNAQELKFNR